MIPELRSTNVAIGIALASRFGQKSCTKQIKHFITLRQRVHVYEKRGIVQHR